MDRMERVAEVLRREICIILQSKVNDPRVEGVTVTRVKVTRDMRIANIFFTVSAEGKEKKDVEKGLKNSSGFIRKELAGIMKLKYIPKIVFRVDTIGEQKKSIDNLFDKISENERLA